MCDACHRQAAQDYWKAVVQVRQKVQIYIYTLQGFAVRNITETLKTPNHEIWGAQH